MSAFVYDEAPTRFVDAGDTRLAYRRLGLREGVPLLLLQRFRGTMDHWDPALLEVLARERPVIVFDSAGVGLSGGEVAPDIAGAARHAVALFDALGLPQVDVLGWSMGGAIAQRLALDWPARVRRLVLAGTGPGGVPDAPRTPDMVWQVAAKPVNDDADFLFLFFAESQASRDAGLASLRRLDRRLRISRSTVRPESWMRQAGAIRAWSMGQGSAYARLAEIGAPALVANGAHDVMVHAYNAYVMTQRMPDARLLLYPDAGHGFLFQYHDHFGRQVNEFLR
jgi:pimeloyl-ACP methyl ester carboxylesterase